MKFICILLAFPLISSCTYKQQTIFPMDYILKRCSEFKADGWSPSDLAVQQLETLNAIEREVHSHAHQAWFENKDGRIGLCEFSNSLRDVNKSCESTYTVFKKSNQVWLLEDESIVICSSGRY